MNKPIQVLLVDDHQLLRESLRGMLESSGDIQVVGSLGSAEEALKAALQFRPQVVLMDIDMPGRLCFEVAREIKQALPDTHVVFLSAFSNDRYIEDALRADATGYLTKDQSSAELAAAIRSAAAGIATFSERVRARLVLDAGGEMRLESGTATRSSALTQRELEVLRYVARGLSKKEIAALLDRSPATVERHTENLMAKLDIHDRVELARFAIREGLAEA
jgi:DNA-binding NarL/FixJ family response regulator